MARKQTRRGKRAQAADPLVLVGLFAVAAVLLLAGLYFAFFANNAGGGTLGPRFSVDQDQIDFGRVPLGKTVKAVFTVTNTGDRDLTLDASAPVKVLKGC